MVQEHVLSVALRQGKDAIWFVWRKSQCKHLITSFKYQDAAIAPLCGCINYNCHDLKVKYGLYSNPKTRKTSNVNLILLDSYYAQCLIRLKK